MQDGKCFFVDTTLCTACRGCQVACKEWNRLPAEKTISQGSLQNPPDLSPNTWKLVRFSESGKEKIKWHFFSDQCRHCLNPPCKEVADEKVKGAVRQDEKTGAVIFNPEMKIKADDFQEIRESCPFDIPRINPETETMAFCNMCYQRIQEGLQPVCVKTCSTGAMKFGNRKAMLHMAEKRLAEVKGRYNNALLTNPGDVRVIYLLVDNPEKYYKYAIAQKPFAFKR